MKLARVTGTVVAAVSCALLAEMAAVAGVGRHDRSDADYFELAGTYDSVGLIRGSTGHSGYLGSGTLVADDWVLTAGHVVDTAASLDFYIGGQRYQAADWIAHPEWDGDLSRGYDIALVHLDRAVDGIDPAERYHGLGEAGSVGTSVGFGRSGEGSTGASTAAGTKRAGQNVVDGFDPRSGGRILTSDFDSPFGLAQPLDLEYLIAPGDSGGGLFLDSPAGPLLAGVHSFGAAYDGTLNSDYGDLSGHIRVAAFNDWIDAIVGRASATASGRLDLAADLVSASQLGANVEGSVPEPSALMLASLAVAWTLCLARRRRR
jgi:hypothetical protein